MNVNSVTRQREREGDIDVSHLVIANKTSLFIFSSLRDCPQACVGSYGSIKNSLKSAFVSK